MTEGFAKCSNVRHKWYGSQYPQEQTPTELFINHHNNTLYKQCVDCRKYIAKTGKKVYSKKRERDAGKEEYECKSCRKMRTENRCDGCERKNAKSISDRILSTKKVIWERIQKTGMCCAQCKNIFIRQQNNAPGFITVSSLDGYTENDIEYHNLEWDHLTEEEQIMQFGKSYGKKKRNISNITSYASKKEESKKCRLLCISCHRLASRQRENPHFNAQREIEKIEYVNAEKMRLGKCEICEHNVDRFNLSYFEFDHKYPENKNAEISRIARSTCNEHTMLFLVVEIMDCRLLCAFCHRLLSANQTRERATKKRLAKRNKDKN